MEGTTVMPVWQGLGVIKTVNTRARFRVSLLQNAYMLLSAHKQFFKKEEERKTDLAAVVLFSLNVSHEKQLVVLFSWYSENNRRTHTTSLDRAQCLGIRQLVWLYL